MERVYVYHWCNFVIQFYIKIRSSKNNLENKRIGILIHQRLDKQDSRFSQIKNYLKNLYTTSNQMKKPQSFDGRT